MGRCKAVWAAELPGGPGWPDEPLTQGETRVLRYLPTHMSSREIADQLYVSTNTVKTHLRHLYQKLGAHSRHEAVDHARTAGLLAVPPPAPHTDRRYEVAYGHAERNLALIRQLEAETRRLLASVDQSDAERSAWMQQDAAALPPPRMPAKRNHR